MDEPDPGKELTRRGWTQGSSFRPGPIPVPHVTRRSSDQEASPPESWEVVQEIADEESYFIITSQACDIDRSAEGEYGEPLIGAIHASWITDRRILHEAGSNSVRRFLLQVRTTAQGKREGLVADIRRCVWIEKSALLAFTPELAYSPDDTDTSSRFQQWLAARYNRPAIEDNLVTDVQRPIIELIGKLRKASRWQPLFDAIREIRFAKHSETRPYNLELAFIEAEGSEAFWATSAGDELLTELVGEIDRVLKITGVIITNAGSYNLRTISAYDYANLIPLPLDQYSR